MPLCEYHFPGAESLIVRFDSSAMLFLRSPGGISHHPDENVFAADVDAAMHAGMEFIASLDVVYKGDSSCNT